MAGSLILTGANGSLAIHAVEHLLKKYPQYTAILTVRDASETDVNTKRLRDIIARYPKAKVSIHQLDLSSLSATHKFADSIISGVADNRYPPISAFIGNAYYWNLIGDPEITADGYDKTFQVNHIAHVALMLRLIGNFGNDGRIVFLSTDAHWPGKNPMEVYPPGIPDDLNLLVNPTADDDKFGRGYHRYATSKLTMTSWIFALNRYLLKSEDLSKVAAVAMNAGNLVDSRALRTNAPPSMARMQTFFYKPFLPLLRLANGPTLRTAGPAGIDVIEMALSPTYEGKRGFFTLLEEDQSSPESQDEEKQQRLWKQSLEWAQITKENTALKSAFE
ncbi:putative short-chain dehydrogenase [Annulohypoxylon truncatum]|uniref:putative short-chain dehydrogenase n=1 Tax=Annulohypoxylon truncatum TaxID=327061 RepID=UPI002008733F|nr:putative short-chain dehydrogenase [Annulohypoxylon truncatum]KAI1215125.1 putative short-chain dehydrogenase [Annulohypoxylon truncatum]